jgi:plastocyanin
MATSSMAMAAGAVMTHTVIVGGAAGLLYTPDVVYAAVGDVVEFQFMQQNHTVTQSSFAEPCKALAGGADSGFMANPNNTVVPPPVFHFTVKAMDPTCKINPCYT